MNFPKRNLMVISVIIKDVFFLKENLQLISLLKNINKDLIIKNVIITDLDINILGSISQSIFSNCEEEKCSQDMCSKGIITLENIINEKTLLDSIKNNIIKYSVEYDILFILKSINDSLIVDKYLVYLNNIKNTFYSNLHPDCLSLCLVESNANYIFGLQWEFITGDMFILNEKKNRQKCILSTSYCIVMNTNYTSKKSIIRNLNLFIEKEKLCIKKFFIYLKKDNICFLSKV